MAAYRLYFKKEDRFLFFFFKLVNTVEIEDESYSEKTSVYVLQEFAFFAIS